MDELTLVTVCRGRLGQLQQTLPRMLDFKVPIVLVDYDCPDLIVNRDWIRGEFPWLKVVRSGPRAFMNLNEARNIGVRAAQTPVVMMIDCDIMIKQQEFMEYAERIMYSKDYVIVRPPNSCLSGTAMFRLQDYVSVGGYDEVVNRYGAGYDEIDFYYKLERSGARAVHFETDLFEHIPHEGRADHYPINHRGLSDQINYLYLGIKSELIGMLGGDTTELDYDYRVVLMDRIYDKVISSIRNVRADSEQTTLDIELRSNQVGAIQLKRTMHYGIDASQILKKCQLTQAQFEGIVERVSKAVKLPV